MTSLHQPSLFSSQQTEAESKRRFAPVGSEDPCFPRRGIRSPAGPLMLRSGASAAPEFNPYRQTVDPQAWFLLTRLQRGSMTVEEKEGGGSGRKTLEGKYIKGKTDKRRQRKEKNWQKRRRDTKRRWKQNQRLKSNTDGKVSQLNSSVWSPLLIGQMEKGIMGSGATGRVEQDLLITRSVSFNLLGGADGWSCTDSKNNKRVSAIRGIYLMCVCVRACVCVWRSDWFCKSYTRRWKDDKKGRKHERTAKNRWKEKKGEGKIEHFRE